MADLSTTYMGLALASPIVVASSTHTILPETVKELEDAGAAAVVLKSIFEEQVRADMAGTYQDLAGHMHPEAYQYLTADLPMRLGPEKYIERLRQIKAAVKIPVIASINCVTATQWVEFAKKIELAGADALELNVYDVPTNPDAPGSEVESRHLDLLASVKKTLTIPAAVKIGPFYSSIVNFARKLDAAGADAIVMFNRFFQPDIDIENLALKSTMNYSRSEDILLPLRWIAIVREQVSCCLSLTTGVHSPEGAVKAILAGADTVQVCSVLYERGRRYVGEIVSGLAEWMDAKGYEEIADFRGLLREKDLTDNQGFERAQYLKAFVGLE